MSGHFVKFPLSKLKVLIAVKQQNLNFEIFVVETLLELGQINRNGE
jgi:hypothetical protein